MKFEQLIEIAGEEPVFETGLLLAGDVDSADVQRQLSRWVQAGRLYQLRRGLYALAPPYQKVRPHPFLVANRGRPNGFRNWPRRKPWSTKPCEGGSGRTHSRPAEPRGAEVDLLSEENLLGLRGS